jgi:hypothetical protein
MSNPYYHLFRDFVSIVKNERMAWRCVLVVALREKASVEVMRKINQQILANAT